MQYPKQHLAIFTPPFLDLILEGRKTIDGRFSRVRCAPFGVVEEGDVVLMKERGGLVRGSFLVAKVESWENLNPDKLKELEKRYSVSLSTGVDKLYWEKRHAARFVTLLYIAEPKRFEQPFPFPKRDRRGWVVLEGKGKEGSAQLFLFHDERAAEEKDDSLKSDCIRGLHAFVRSPLVNQSGNPRCRWCGADCVDWPLLHKRDRSAVLVAIHELRKEFWRDSWLKRQIDVKAENHALRKGRDALRSYAENRIRKSVGSEQPYRDGFQTPYRGNVIYYAQHAIAACCRNCIKVWHGIAKGKKLAEEEIAYLVELVMQYVDIVMPELGVRGIYIPPIRKRQRRKGVVHGKTRRLHGFEGKSSG